MVEIASGVASTLLEKLTTKAYQEIVLAWGLNDDIERLKESVRLISDLLGDAEDKQFKNQSITTWLQQLKNAFYDASDILDEIECEANANKVMKMYGSCSQKVSRFFSRSNSLVFRVKMTHKMKDIREKIDEIAHNGNNFGLVQHFATHEMALNKKLPWRETYSSLPSRVIGRDEEKEEIVSLLMSKPSQSQLDVVPIVAMGGCGKTTLAQLVYNDTRIDNHYDLRIWVHVSPNFDVKRIISEIVTSGDGKGRSGGEDSLENLKSHLHGKLHDKKFLLVLDDVWNKNATIWDQLRDLLLDAIGERNKNESKILVTTRSHEVASIVKTGPKIDLKMLPEEECLKLFFKCAFQVEAEANQHQRLKEIGKDIVAKCGGLPLAVVTLGCMLRSTQDENEWKKIRDSEIWEIKPEEEEDGGILPALRLSYFQLPSPLKQCFSYCAVFPKNHEYKPIELLPFWMAHGLLQPTNENEDPEYLGESYFKQLISASFFQPTFDAASISEQAIIQALGGVYKMHDRVHDLAMVTMHGEIKVMTSSDSKQVNEKVRHLISTNSDQLSLLTFKKNKVQSLIKWSDIEEKAPELFTKLIFKECKYLRVLDLQNSDLHLLPDCFGKMKHLRFLSLVGCRKLEKLPKSICKLYNLQSLVLPNCEELRELPENMRNLVNLRFLIITAQITNLCLVDIRFFNSLQVLGISCPHLEVLPCDLGHLVSLKKLLIGGCNNLVRFEDEVGNERGGKDMNLQLFTIQGSPKLINFPNWLQKATKTLQLIFIDGTRLTSLPEWLPNAKSLNILYIKDCEELLSLPTDMDHSRSLQDLGIIHCPKLYARYKKNVGPEWSKIAHIPNVDFGESYDGEFEE